MRKAILLLFVGFFLIGAGSCSGVVRQDTSPVSALEANDATVIIDGCGAQPIVGYAYCRVGEGSAADRSLFLIAPPAKCQTKPCVTFKIFYPTGEPAKGIDVPDGETRVQIAWKDLLKRETFEKGDRGFWPIVMEWKWLEDKDGQIFERHSAAEGEIRLRVLSKDYIPLHEVARDQNFVWEWVEGTTNYRLTTAGRAYAGAQ